MLCQELWNIGAGRGLRLAPWRPEGKGDCQQVDIQ